MELSCDLVRRAPNPFFWTCHYYSSFGGGSGGGGNSGIRVAFAVALASGRPKTELEAELREILGINGIFFLSSEL